MRSAESGLSSSARRRFILLGSLPGQHSGMVSRTYEERKNAPFSETPACSAAAQPRSLVLKGGRSTLGAVTVGLGQWLQKKRNADSQIGYSVFGRRLPRKAFQAEHRLIPPHLEPTGPSAS